MTILILTIFLTFMTLLSNGQDIIDYWENGKIKSEGRYEHETHQECAYFETYDRTYTYKVGKWTYWYDNGEKMAEGNYVTKTKKIKTNCKGGAKIRYGAFHNNWKCWDEKGNEIKLNTLLKNGQLSE